MKGFPCTVEIPVRFSDTDAMGHTNNAVYLSYLEEARFQFFRDALNIRDASKIDVILARVEIDFRSPSFCGETLVVGVRTTRVGGASFASEYRIEEKNTGRLVAEASSVQVCYDYASGKPARLSPERVRALKASLTSPSSAGL